MAKNLLQAALTALGLSPKSSLTTISEEQKQQLRDVWGDKFADSFIAKFEAGEILTTGDVIDVVATQSSAAAIDDASIASELETLRAENSKLSDRLAKSQQTIEILSSEPEDDVVAVVDVNATGAASTVKKVADNTLLHNKTANAFLATGALDVSAASLDLGDIKTEFGKVVNPSEKKRFFDAIRQGFSSSKYFSPQHGILEYQAISSVKKSVLQAFNPKWTPVTGFEFKPLKVKNYHHKINVAITPAEVISTWLMYLYSENLKPGDQPLVKFIIDHEILPQVLEDLELKAVWKGKYTAPSQTSDGDSAGDAFASMDGIETQLVAAKAAAGTSTDVGVNFINSTIDLSKSSNADILAHVDAFNDALSPVFKSKKMPLFCSREFYTRYKRAYKEKWGLGSGTQDPNFGTDQVDNALLYLTPIDGMYGSPILFATPKENLIQVINLAKVPNVINDIQSQNYDVKIFGEFWMGVGFAYPAAVFASVPAGYDPQAVFTSSSDDEDNTTETTQTDSQTQNDNV